MTRSSSAIQFSIEIETKDKLDRYKMDNKDDILKRMRAQRRMVTNDMVISYLLEQSVQKRGQKNGGRK